MNRLIKSFSMLSALIATVSFATEVPLCRLPQANSSTANHAISETEAVDPGCVEIIANAKKVAETTQSTLKLENKTLIPPQLSVGAVYLQPITMAPTGMMRTRSESDIHLEVDIHAKQKLKSRGFAPGDWLPNVDVTYTIQKIGDTKPLPCGANEKIHGSMTGCELMAMVAADGAHYGDNIKLAGPGFYIVTFDAHTDPGFGWHTDTDSKILGTEFVDWRFTQSYLLKWTGIGKKGGY